MVESLENQQIVYSKEIQRKLIHMAAGIIPALYIVLEKEVILAVLFPLTAIFIICDFSRHYQNAFADLINQLFGGMLRQSETGAKKLSGGSFTMLAACICILFYERDIAIASLMVAAFADPAAALIGRKIGRIEFLKGKTVEGTIAFIIIGMLIIAGLANLLERDALFIIVGLIGVCMAAVFEATSKLIKIDDNFSVPIINGFFMGILLR